MQHVLSYQSESFASCIKHLHLNSLHRIIHAADTIMQRTVHLFFCELLIRKVTLTFADNFKIENH